MFFNEFQELLFFLLSSPSEFVSAGDFNLHFDEKPQHKQGFVDIQERKLGKRLFRMLAMAKIF